MVSNRIVVVAVVTVAAVVAVGVEIATDLRVSEAIPIAVVHVGILEDEEGVVADHLISLVVVVAISITRASGVAVMKIVVDMIDTWTDSMKTTVTLMMTNIVVVDLVAVVVEEVVAEDQAAIAEEAVDQ